MPSTYSSRLRLELIGAGEQTGTWGTTTNTNLGTLIEQAIAGVAAVVMTDANYTLVASNGSSDEARCAVLQVTGTLTAARNVTCPTASKVYLIYNNTTGGFAITLKTAAGSGISVPNGKKMFLYCDGTDVVDSITNFSAGLQVGGSDIATLTASQALTNKTIGNTNTVTLKDTLFTLQDDGDATKQLQFQLSGITTGTTRTFTAPDANLTIVGTATTQTLQNKTLDNTNTVTVKDTLFTIQDDGDATKQAVFQASGITTGNTRTLTIPDASTTLVGTGATQTLTNKTLDNSNTVTFRDDRFTMQDNADTTKQLQFQLSGIATGTTRTLTVPDANSTILTQADAASQAQLETASSTTVFSSPGRQQFHPGHPKAWMCAKGRVTTAINTSYNITSFSRSSAGQYTATLTTAMSSIDYAVGGCAFDASSGNNTIGGGTAAKLTTTVVPLGSFSYNSGSNNDMDQITFIACGDQ